MTWLLVAIVCSSGIAIVFSWSERFKTQWSGILVANYFFAAVMSLPFFLHRSFRWFSLPTAFESFLQEFPLVFLTTSSFSHPGSFAYAISLGIIGGLLFFASLFLYRYSIRYNGLALSGTFAKLGISVPVILSLLFWKIFPSYSQWFGIILSLVAVFFLHNWKHANRSNRFSLSLGLLLLLMGLAEFSNKVFQQYALPSYNSLFLFVVFSTALLYSIANQCFRKTIFRWKEIGFGLCIGVLNYGSSYFLLRGLEDIPAALAFPTFSAGTIIFISLFSWIVLREKMTRNVTIAILLSIMSVIFMNMK
jgi:drug/metabolite transporter (DMT)-like permease